MTIMVSKGWVAGPDWDVKGEFNQKFDPQPGRCGFLWDHAVIHNDGGVAPCCAVFYKEDDYGNIAGSAGRTPAEPSVPMSELHEKNFHEVWNNAQFRSSRRMFANRPNEPRNADLVCYDCPVTDVWRKQRAHLTSGGKGTVGIDLAYNEGFNYFFNRRPERATDEGLIPLAEIKDKTPV